MNKEGLHDGLYESSYIGIETQMSIEGNRMRHTSSMTAEMIVDCQQFKDRIEYTDAKGVKRILRVRNDSTLYQTIGNQELVYTLIRK